MKRILIPALLVLAAAALLPAEGAGYNWYYSLVTARYPLTVRTRSCVICHTRAGTENLNRFGAEFLAAGADGRALATIAGRDPDGDGVTSDVELRSGHFPGEGADVPSPAEVVAAGARRAAPGDLEREIFETLQCPCCDKLVMNCKCDMVPEIRNAVRAGVARGRKPGEIREALVARFGRKILPLAERGETLPAGDFQDRRVANAYRIAAAIPRELEKYPCFCPCYRANGHLSLLDCYKNEHGARCAVCMDEAEAIEAMVRDRVPETGIRERLVTRFRGHP